MQLAKGIDMRTYTTSGRLREVKRNIKLQTVISKVVAVAYERRSPTRGGRFREVPTIII